MLYAWIIPLSIVGAIFVIMIAALEFGYQRGRRARPESMPDGSHLGGVLGAMLGLVALLLGFSYAGASGRFVERQQLVVREANAIGTAYLRADLLPEPHRAALKGALREYAACRLTLLRTRELGAIRAEEDRASAMHAGLWAPALESTRAVPQLAVAILPAVNEVIDLHTTHAATIRRHIPTLALGVLMLSACLSLGLMGFSAGLTKKRNHAVTLLLSVLVAMALWVTVDLDYPRLGLIRVDDRPMVDTIKSMAP